MTGLKYCERTKFLIELIEKRNRGAQETWLVSLDQKSE
jgi:hypothetical protein